MHFFNTEASLSPLTAQIAVLWRGLEVLLPMQLELLPPLLQALPGVPIKCPPKIQLQLSQNPSEKSNNAG